MLAVSSWQDFDACHLTAVTLKGSSQFLTSACWWLPHRQCIFPVFSAFVIPVALSTFGVILNANALPTDGLTVAGTLSASDQVHTRKH